jgi:hypothetical protein
MVADPPTIETEPPPTELLPPLMLTAPDFPTLEEPDLMVTSPEEAVVEAPLPTVSSPLAPLLDPDAMAISPLPI